MYRQRLLSTGKEQLTPTETTYSVYVLHGLGFVYVYTFSYLLERCVRIDIYDGINKRDYNGLVQCHELHPTRGHLS